MDYKEFKKITLSAEDKLELTPEQFADILLQSFDFELDGDDIKQAITDGEDVKIEEKDREIDYFDEKVKVYTTNVNSWVYITSKDSWERILKNAGYKYVEDIDPFIEDYFDKDSFINDLFTDKGLADKVLEKDDIDEYEVVEDRNKTYIIFKS